MPQRFNTGTSLQPVNPTLEPVNENPSGQPQNVAAVTGQVLGSIIDQFADNSGKGTRGLDAFTVAAMDVVDEAASYKKEKDRIYASIATADPNDKAAVGKYMDDLRRLRRGEVQGTMSSSDAQLRINNLTKQAINAYPGMALKFRQLRAGLVSDLPSVTGDSEVDPDVAATNDLIKESRSNGWGLQEQIAFNNSKKLAEAQQMTLEAKTRTGSASEADVANSVLLQSGMVYSKFMADMGNSTNNPNFQGVQWIPQLRMARGQLEQSINQVLTQTMLDKNMKFSSDFMNNTIKAALDPLDQLIEVAKAVDNPKQRAESAQFLLQAQRAGDILKLREIIGPMAVLANSTQDIMMYLNEISRYREQINNGQRPELDKLSKEGDVKARLILGVIDGKDFNTNLAEAVRATTEGKDIPPSTLPEEHKMKTQVSINAALSPRTSKEDSQNMLVTLAGQPSAFEAWDARNDVKDRTKLMVPVQNALRANAVKQQMSAIKQLNPEDFGNIKFDALNNDHPFSVSSSVLSAGPGSSGVPGGVYGDTLKYINPNTKAFVDSLNQQYRVLSSFTNRPEIQKWAAESIDQLKAASDSSFKPTPVVAPAEPTPAPAPAAPVEATIAKNGDVQFGRFSVARTTYSIRDAKTNQELSPPALERLRQALSDTPAGDQLEAALDFSYSTEESDNGKGN